MIRAASVVASIAYAQSSTEILTQNAKTWDSAIELSPNTGFEPTAGLNIRGEIGWHTHGSGDLKDTDIDLAIILETDETIDPSYTTMVLWGLPMNESGIVYEKLEYEVGYLAYQPPYNGSEQTWILKQTIVEGINGSVIDIYNDSGIDFDSMVQR